MAEIVGYIASSLDGYIATKQGRLEWLFKYNDMDQGEFPYAKFMGSITIVVMGRDTYDFLAAEETPWPYPDQQAIVVTSRPITNPKGNIEIWHDSIDALITNLRGRPDGKVWMLGGGRLQSAFIERGALDEIEIYVIPELIGSGIPLFPASEIALSPKLISATTLGLGVVRLHYRLAP